MRSRSPKFKLTWCFLDQFTSTMFSSLLSSSKVSFLFVILPLITLVLWSLTLLVYLWMIWPPGAWSRGTIASILCTSSHFLHWPPPSLMLHHTSWQPWLSPPPGIVVFVIPGTTPSPNYFMALWLLVQGLLMSHCVMLVTWIDMLGYIFLVLLQGSTC
jgi:hypothetical protein